MEKHMAVCPYCGAGCKLNLIVDDGMVIGAEGLDGVTNEGELCLKGLSGFDFINDTKILTPRILHPMIRREKGGELERVTWDEALDFTAKKLMAIKEKYGPDAIMLTGSSRGPGNEANYVMQKFTRACVGTNNIDNCARTCHGPSVIGLMDTVGSGAMSVSIPNMENADLIMLFGYNPSASHPIVARRIVKAKEKGAKIIVVDPRSIETARIADLYIQIKNGCNLAFMNAFANVIVSENLHDRAFIDAHTNGFDEWWETIKNYTPESVADICGCSPDDIRKAARMYATAPNSIIGWGMGVTQQRQGVKTVHTIAAIACVTNQIGRDNAGLAPVRGQNNVQGSCDMGMWPSLLPGYQKVENPEARAKFEKAWGLPEGKLPAEPGFKLTDLPHGVKEGKIKAFYNFGEDPLQTEPDSADMKETLENLELLISQDIFMTQTTALADVVFPGTSWGEHDGVFSASDRTFQRFTAAVPPKGECKHDWQIFSELSTRMGYPMHYEDTQEIWDEMRSLCPNFYGATYEKMAGVGHAQWPIPTLECPGTPTLYKNGQFNTADKKAILMAHDFVEPTEMPDDAYPLVLCTVPLYDRQLQGALDAGRRAGLRAHQPRRCRRPHRQGRGSGLGELAPRQGDHAREAGRAHQQGRRLHDLPMVDRQVQRPDHACDRPAVRYARGQVLRLRGALHRRPGVGRAPYAVALQRDERSPGCGGGTSERRARRSIGRLATALIPKGL